MRRSHFDDTSYEVQKQYDSYRDKYISYALSASKSKWKKFCLLIVSRIIQGVFTPISLAIRGWHLTKVGCKYLIVTGSIKATWHGIHLEILRGKIASCQEVLAVLDEFDRQDEEMK